jgi:shikimate dehydrogenase
MRHFGLIGFPLLHSFSKKFFTQKFESESIDALYELYELKNIADFPILFERTPLDGLNVTIPYKQQVIQFLDVLDDTAAEIGAVNVIKFIRSEKKMLLKGYNSDAIGFENSIKPFLNSSHTNALILGTGGASKAIDYVLRKNGIKTTFVSRTEIENGLTYHQLTKNVLDENLVIVNTTPVGTFPHVDECPLIPYKYITEKHLLYDLVYNPAVTQFLERGRAKGAICLNGEAMLIGQAEAAWAIWNE